MGDTASGTAGTATGVKLEMSGFFSFAEKRAQDKAMNAIGVPLKDIHTDGVMSGYDDQVVIMSRSDHPNISKARSEISHRLMTDAWTKKYRDDLQAHRVHMLPEGGEILVRIEAALASLRGWEGCMEDAEGKMHDLSLLDAFKLQSWIRANRLPTWGICKIQLANGLPPYDADTVDMKFLIMLERANERLDSDIDFFALRDHLANGTSGKAFKILPVGSFDQEETVPESE